MTRRYVADAAAAEMDSLVPGASAFFNRQLEQFERRILMQERRPLSGLEHFPIYPGVDPNAERFTRRMYEGHGQGRFYADGVNDPPIARTTAIEESVAPKNLWAGYQYTMEDLRKSQFTGINLNEMDVRNALTHVEELRNDLIWNGDATYNLFGVLTHPFIPRLATGVATGAAIGVIQPAVTGAIHAVADDSEDKRVASHLIFGSRLYRRLNSIRRANTDTTAMQMISENTGIGMENIGWANELNGAGPGGVDLMIAYQRDPDVCGVVLPQMAQMLPVLQKGHLLWEGAWIERCGGVISNYPLGMKVISFTDAL